MTLTQTNSLPIDVQRWSQGLSLEEYVQEMNRNQDKMRRRLAQVNLSLPDRSYFESLDRPIKVLVMTEDWCGDSLMNLPILVKISRSAPNMQLRIFIRDRFLELRQHYASQGIFSIPVFAFLNPDFTQIDTWVERPQQAQIREQQWYAAHPEIETIKASNQFTQDEKRALMKPLYRRKLSQMEDWYNQGLQQATVDEIKAILCPRRRAWRRNNSR